MALASILLLSPAAALALPERAMTNYINGAELAARVITGSEASPDLVDRLSKTLQKISDLADTDPGAAAKASKQLIGEASISSMTLALTAARQVQNIQGVRLHEYRDNPWSGAGQTTGYGSRLNRVWISGLGQWARQSDRDGVYGYKADIGGVAFGVDREAASVPGLQVGLSGSVSTGRLKNNDGRGKTDFEAASIGLYGSYNFWDGFFIDGNAAYGLGQHTTKTNLLIGGRKEGDFDSRTYQAGVTFGYVYRDPSGFKVTPSVGVQYYHYSQDGWREKVKNDPGNDVVANWFKKRDNDTWEAPVKLKANTTLFTRSGLILTPELRLGLICVLHKPSAKVRMGFVGSDDYAQIYGIDSSRNRFQAGAGLKAQLTGSVDVFMDYDLEFRTGQRSHNASLGLGVDF